MKRLYTSTDEPGQGAVPRDFNTPEDCLDLGLPAPLDPPGCSEWTVTSNDYGALPRRWASAQSSGDLYFDLFEGVTFVYDPDWTDLWSTLSQAQQDLLYQIGCYCDDEGISTPTLTVGPLQFPPVNSLPFFWIPPALTLSTASVRPENPVDRKPGTCCPDNTVGKFNLEINPIDGRVNARMEMPKEPEYRFRSSYTNPDALLQNGFPKFCCFEDECDPKKQVWRYVHYPRWLEDVYDPYGAQPQEPVGAVPVVMDLNFDPETGVLCLPLGYMTFHDGDLHAVEWSLPDHVSKEATPGEYDFQDPAQPGVDLDYNKDWFGDDILVINKIGDPCADQCDALGETDCVPECDADKFGPDYALENTYTAVAASEVDAVAAALADAQDAAPGLCADYIVELCYSKATLVANQFEAVAAVYCSVT